LDARDGSEEDRTSVGQKYSLMMVQLSGVTKIISALALMFLKQP
jgi:hypothetical protein